MSGQDPYFLGYRQAERQRLEQPAEELARDSKWLFDAIGIREGSRVVEIGCGPHGCLQILSERVGEHGRVIGVERNDQEVQRARQFVSANRLANVDVIHGDARATGLPSGTFDVATERTVLVNVPNPEQIIAEMVRLVRPGGVVALHEADCIGHQMCHPPLPAWKRLTELLDAYAGMNGIDRYIGRRLPGMLRTAGLTDIGRNSTVHAFPPGHARRMLQLQFVENLRDRLLGAGLIGEAGLDELAETLKRHLEDPETEVYSVVFVQTWGCRPSP